MDGSQFERRCQERKEKSAYYNTHANMIQTHANNGSRHWQHAHKHTHSLAPVPANRGCYQFISASSCRGQTYWRCSDEPSAFSGTVDRQIMSFWFNQKRTDAGIKVRPLELPYGLLPAKWPAASKWLTDRAVERRKWINFHPTSCVCIIQTHMQT